MKRCHAEAYCKQFNEQRSNCHEFCIGYVQLQNIYALSNIPKKYQFSHDHELYPDDEDLEAFRTLKRWSENVLENIEAGEGLFIYSEAKGTGKTTWACKIMNEFFKKVALTNNLRCRGLYVKVPNFLQQIRDSFNDEQKRSEVAQTIRNIERCDLVVWDEIGAEKPSEFVRERLLSLIDHRESNGMSQIYTSNVHLDMLANPNWLDERIVSRIKGQCEIIEFVSKTDHREDRHG